MAAGLADDLRRAETPDWGLALKAELALFIRAVEDRLEDLEADDGPVVASESPSSSLGGTVVVNLDTGGVHGTMSTPGWDPSLGRSKCDWTSQRRRFERPLVIPEVTPWRRICDRCLPNMRCRVG